MPLAPVLRDYQQSVVSRCIARLQEGRAPILVAPTGAGKTVSFVALALRLGEPTLVVAHRRELIFQAKGAIEAAGGEAGVILSGEEEDRDRQFQVASVQTLARRDLPDAGLLIIDEAHHATSDSYRRLVDKYSRRLGATATPFRLDGKGLRDAGFDCIEVAAYSDDLCALGTLHEPVVYAGPAPDLSGVKKTAGDYNLGQLASAVRTAALDGRIVETWQKRAAGRRTVVFAVDVAHAFALATAFTAAGVVAEVVTGETPKPERNGVLARLASGVTTIVVNVGVLTEGWDLPALECAVVARPTASLCLHLQQIGRVMRACDGKDGAIVLDHAGNAHRHGLVTRRLVYSLDGKVKKEPGQAPEKTCPECARVVPAGVRVCPECGYEFEREDKTTESDAELVPIGHGDSFEERARRWHAMKVDACRVVRWQSGGELLWDETTTSRAFAIAASKFKARYGDWPLALPERLVDPATASEEDWARLRERWRSIGRSKGWPENKVDWFTRKCEAEARAKAPKGIAARRDVATMNDLLPGAPGLAEAAS